MPPQFTPEETAVITDIRLLRAKFLPLFGPQWDEELWQNSVAEFTESHDSDAITSVLEKIKSSWEVMKLELSGQTKSLKDPDFHSPLVGQKVDLSFLDDASSIEWIRGSSKGWKDARLLVFDMWASWCWPCIRTFGHLSDLVEKHGQDNVRFFGINEDQIFGEEDPVDVVRFVADRKDMRYDVGVDKNFRARKALYDGCGQRSIPGVIVVSPDGLVHFVGRPHDLDIVIEDVLVRLADRVS